MHKSQVRQGMSREQGSSHLMGPDHTLHPSIPCVTLTIYPPFFCNIPGVRHVEEYCNQMPQTQYGQQQLKSINSKMSNILKRVILQEVDKCCSKALMGLIEMESMTVMCPSRAFIAAEIL